jgi:hypothetical protein
MGTIFYIQTYHLSNKKGNKKSKTVVVYDREAELVFSYNFKRSRDGSLVGAVAREGKTSDSNEDRRKLRSPSDMARTIVTKSLSGLARDVAPYKVTETRALMKEKSKDKYLQNQMKDAYRLVKAESYRVALNSYLSIYGAYNNFAAGYNAAILYEVIGDLDSAAGMMEELLDETGNPKASTELARLRRAIGDREILARVYHNRQSRTDKLIAEMVVVIQGKLPENAKVAVMNNSRIETGLASTMVDGITFGLRDQGITIVDRNNTALVEAEKRYQMSGEVSDDDFVGIGHEAGVNTFVLVAITGTSSTRRLQVRMLDVATNEVLYQTPASDNMNL